jgi:RNA polymerase sigma factor (TIGR02999 family)
MKAENEISFLLGQWNKGDNKAFEEMFNLVEHELHQIAQAHMRKECINHTFQTTALINEAYLRLVQIKSLEWQNRAHFFAIASKVMRRILLDHAKTRLRDKRGGGAVHVNIEEAYNISVEKSAEIIAIDEALNHLAKVDPLKSKIVEMRHFGGMTVDETAKVLGLAPITVIRHWNLAKVWLLREITGK